MCTSLSLVNQISNFFGLYSRFVRIFIIKISSSEEPQTPRVSTELETVVNLSYYFIPLQNILQKGVDPAEVCQKYQNGAERAEQILLARAQLKCPATAREIISIRIATVTSRTKMKTKFAHTSTVLQKNFPTAFYFIIHTHLLDDTLKVV